MHFRIADTFTDSLSRLTSDEQKAVKTSAFDLQMNAAQPGLSFHKLDKAKDKNFWSVRVNADIRLIIHKSAQSLLLCYVDHHDKAYHWAERRKLETHPTTGAAQLVEIRERVEEVVVRKIVEQAEIVFKPLLFARHDDAELLSYGVPPDWLSAIRQANDDTLLDLVTHLPAEAAEALLQLAVGAKPQPKPVAEKGVSPFDHPDAQRRFRVMSNLEELQQALEYPWEKWTTFLHPEQRQMVSRNYKGPARVSGSAGTGKTIVALHRAVHLAGIADEQRVLLTTFSETLANALRAKLRRLIGNQPRIGERLEVQSLDAVARRLYERHIGKLRLATDDEVRQLVEQCQRAQGEPARRFGLRFLVSEWQDLVDAWQLGTWDAYRDVKRLGRKTRLSEAQRQVLWTIFEGVQKALAERGWITSAAMFTALAQKLASMPHPAFEHVVVDEAQDLSIAQIKFLAALGSTNGVMRSNSLFFAGDLGQRIFQQPFSWKTLGVDVRGRSKTLQINYRTSHQIRMQADQLLGPQVSDVDGNAEDRKGTVSVFNGPAPVMSTSKSADAEGEAVASWLREQMRQNVQPHEIGIFVRSAAEIARAIAAAKLAELPHKLLDEKVETTHGSASICAMHLAKGLEFRVVVVMACDDEVIPSQARIEAVGDEADLDEVYNTERHLLYVACTRARDQLLVSGVEPVSEFLADFSLAHKART
ncbi:MAG: UvrD-helicase domain-containing protein [Verrucomicrobia bacterium]|nr:UvrD-helicase domain-containing protein [Verrucomicrobiota bacterium]